MNIKAHEKSSIKVPGDQMPGFKRELRVNDVLDLGRIATLPFNELKEPGSGRRTRGIVLYNPENVDTEQQLGLRDAGLLPCVTVPSRQDEFHQPMYRAWRSKNKFFNSLNAEGYTPPFKPINT